MTNDELLTHYPALAGILSKQQDWLDQAVTTEEAAQITGVPISTLVTLRSKGGGPVYLRPNGLRLVRYFRRNLYAWLLSGGVKHNTASHQICSPGGQENV